MPIRDFEVFRLAAAVLILAITSFVPLPGAELVLPVAASDLPAGAASAGPVALSSSASITVRTGAHDSLRRVIDADGVRWIAADAPQTGRTLPPVGRLIVKLADGADVCVSYSDRRADLRRLVPQSHLDDLLRYHGLRATGRLLGGPTDARRRMRLASGRRAGGVLHALPEFDRTWILEGRARPDIEQLAHEITADALVQTSEASAVGW